MTWAVCFLLLSCDRINLAKQTSSWFCLTDKYVLVILSIEDTITTNQIPNSVIEIKLQTYKEPPPCFTYTHVISQRPSPDKQTVKFSGQMFHILSHQSDQMLLFSCSPAVLMFWCIVGSFGFVSELWLLRCNIRNFYWQMGHTSFIES